VKKNTYTPDGGSPNTQDKTIKLQSGNPPSGSEKQPGGGAV
jgi:hypothetical protein